MLAVSLAKSQGSRFKVRLFIQWAFVVFAAASAALAGCAGLRGSKPLTAASRDNNTSFGGAQAVEIPSSAYAMGAYLKALVATEGGDRHEALDEFEKVVRYDPRNAALHLKLATLFVQDGRL